jgi:hypothetical protein
MNLLAADVRRLQVLLQVSMPSRTRSADFSPLPAEFLGTLRHSLRFLAREDARPTRAGPTMRNQEKAF